MEAFRFCFVCFSHGCATSEEIFWKLGSIQAFIQDLHWPDDIFGEHIATRLKLMAADMTEAIVTRLKSLIKVKIYILNWF